ncbi:MAG: HK97 gp10 family phage protein [Hydrogenophilales bacterium]|nr:HK97 gp10 family phage protein [Hydrogenophilales bacterium]
MGQLDQVATIKLEGWERLERAMQTAPAVVDAELKAFTAAALMFLEGEVKDRTPQGAHGHLAQSVTSEAGGGLADGILGVVSSALPYAIPVELGTKPHMPPILPLMEWVQHKLGAGKNMNEIESIARRIAWKIKHHGTKGAFMFKGAFDAGQDEVKRQFLATMNRILTRVEGTA